MRQTFQKNTGNVGRQLEIDKRFDKDAKVAIDKPFDKDAKVATS